VEGATARHSATAALLLGVLFPLRLHAAAIRRADRRQLRWIALELTLNVAALAVGLGIDGPVARYHLAAMAAGQALSGFFAVWTVHHDCDRWEQIARTLRHRFKSAIACNMFYHLEHHLYPRVPTCRLPLLAERLDRAVPDLDRRMVY
jgi:fatty acid desaturase